MKVIDLLNKIAKGEEVPKKIKYENDTYIHAGNYCYYCDETNLILSDRLFAEYSKLNEEVEVIEKKTPQEIIKQISKMIASGKISKDIYDEYLGNCPIGFMNENELVDFLLEIKKLEDMIDESLFEDKDIEKISWNEKESLAGIPTQKEQLEILARRSEKTKKVLNKLIDEVNKLKGKYE